MVFFLFILLILYIFAYQKIRDNELLLKVQNENLRKQIANLNKRIIILEDKCGDDGK